MSDDIGGRWGQRRLVAPSPPPCDLVRLGEIRTRAHGDDHAARWDALRCQQDRIELLAMIDRLLDHSAAR